MKVKEVLTFRLMVAPAILQILFWAGIGGTLYGTYVLIRLGHWAWPLALVFGVLWTRVLFEVALLVFRIYDRLGEIVAQLETSAKDRSSR